ncbi:MAG: hypothetical protein ABIB79_00275 [archaeon]
MNLKEIFKPTKWKLALLGVFIIGQIIFFSLPQEEVLMSPNLGTTLVSTPHSNMFAEMVLPQSLTIFALYCIACLAVSAYDRYKVK